jgi:hypothetical protein
MNTISFPAIGAPDTIMVHPRRRHYTDDHMTDIDTTWVDVDDDDAPLPRNIDPVIGTLTKRWYRDLAGTPSRDSLIGPAVWAASGSYINGVSTKRRAISVFDWLARVYLPAWLDVRGIPNTLRTQRRIVTVSGMTSMRSTLDQIRRSCEHSQEHDTPIMATVLAYRLAVRQTGAAAAQAAIIAANPELGIVAGTTDGGRPEASGGTLMADIVLASTYCVAGMIHDSGIDTHNDRDVQKLLSPVTCSLQSSASRMLNTLIGSR